MPDNPGTTPAMGSDYPKTNISFSGGKFFHRDKGAPYQIPVRLTREVIHVGCMTITPAAAVKIVEEWQSKFKTEEKEYIL